MTPREHSGYSERGDQETLPTAPQPSKARATLPTCILSYLSWVPSARPATKT